MIFYLGLGSESGIRSIREIAAENIDEAEKLYLLNIKDKKDFETVDIINYEKSRPN
jgi:hypothetical protein